MSYRCALCPHPRWVDGTYRDAIEHYRDHHQEQGDASGPT